MQQNKVGEQKLYKQFGHFNIVFLLSAVFTVLNAASFSEFKKSQADSFTQYLDNKDKEFNKYLGSNWEEYSSKQAASLYQTPKPNKIETASKINFEKRGPIVHLAKKSMLDGILSNKKKTPSKIRNKKEIELSFFATEVGFDIPSGTRKAMFYPKSKVGISNFFNALISTEYEKLVTAIDKATLELNLNDWGKYLLVKELSEKIFANQDDSRLLEWFIFNKLGYSVRVGLAKKHIQVMYESEKTIYNTPIYTIDKKNFYLISNYGSTSRNVHTYKQNYPDANRCIDLTMASLPNLKKSIKTKSLTFQENMKKYTIDFRYNQNIIDFMATYPQVEYGVFFNTPMQDESYKDIVNGLRKYINGKRTSSAINFVLHFVQNAFMYQDDASQFGREKVMFADETLFYDKSDCEDRAILFSKLVKDIFKIDVVGVKYNDHMATALYVPLKGDTVRVNMKKYVIADPTYINASIGQGMSKYKSLQPKEFIFFNN